MEQGIDNVFEEFRLELEKVNNSYSRRSLEVKRIWEGFDSEASKLIQIVSQKFKNVLDEICPVVTLWNERPASKDKATVKDYKIIYEPHAQEFRIEIESFYTSGNSSSACPHIFLGPITGYRNEVDSRIQDFKDNYNISYIKNPVNNCDHK